MKRFVVILLIGIGVVLAWIGCDNRPPDRNQIPILKKRLFELQEAVKDKNRARIDSLLSVKILDYDQSSDSLLSFVYGPDRDFAFEQFALGEIKYGRDAAQIDCFVMDTTHQRNRPLMMTYRKDDDLWLLSRFLIPDSLSGGAGPDR